jgi:hypothetical protein
LLGSLVNVPFIEVTGSILTFFTVYERYGSTCLSSIVFWNALPMFWLSGAEAIKAVSTDRALFSKDVEAVSLTCHLLDLGGKLKHVQYEPLNIYGRNIVGTEGLEWKRHRSVANSAFNEVSVVVQLAYLYPISLHQANNALVWRESARVIHEWFEEIEGPGGPVPKGNSIDLLKALTQVGGGHTLGWRLTSRCLLDPDYPSHYRISWIRSSRFFQGRFEG